MSMLRRFLCENAKSLKEEKKPDPANIQPQNSGSGSTMSFAPEVTSLKPQPPQTTKNKNVRKLSFNMEIEEELKYKFLRLELKEDIFQQQLFLVDSKDDSVRYNKRTCNLGEVYLVIEKKSEGTQSFGSFKLPLSPQANLITKVSSQQEKPKTPEVFDQIQLQSLA